MKRYYSTDVPDDVGTTFVRIKAAMDIALSKVKSVQIKQVDVKNSRLTGGDFDYESPQMKFSKFAKDKMSALSKDPATWEATFLAILTNLHENKSMDAYVRFSMIKYIEKYACMGSLYLSKELEDDLDILAKSDIDPNANWIDPDDVVGKKERLKAVDALRRFKDPEEARRRLAAYLESLNRMDLGPDYEWVGWLHRDRKNQWTITYAKQC